ncbi:MAG: KamA family radical SAM protein [Chlamydiota bacterium]|nr:KamA family radical SAM protein [Chlamydiota bacterium]
MRWQAIQRSNFRERKALADFLALPEGDRQTLSPDPAFPLNLPLRLAQKIEKGNINDPILLQFLPQKKEQESRVGDQIDPVGDAASCTTPRLLHKYHGRALLLCSGACTMHCRFCFRQHYPYAEGGTSFEEELAAIRSDPSLREIILSGGDPLSLSDPALLSLIHRLESIPHLTLLRIHSRFPLGIPERVTPALREALIHSRLQVIFALHINHPREADPEVMAALSLLREGGIPILSQTVLLKGVNDDVETLHSLFQGLIESGIMPYYLHQLDPVVGASHFRVSPSVGLHLIDKLRNLLPGYALPRYVQEIAGASSKSPLI